MPPLRAITNFQLFLANVLCTGHTLKIQEELQCAGVVTFARRNHAFMISNRLCPKLGSFWGYIYVVARSAYDNIGRTIR